MVVRQFTTTVVAVNANRFFTFEIVHWVHQPVLWSLCMLADLHNPVELFFVVWVGLSVLLWLDPTVEDTILSIRFARKNSPRNSVLAASSEVRPRWCRKLILLFAWIDQISIHWRAFQIVRVVTSLVWLCNIQFWENFRITIKLCFWSCLRETCANYFTGLSLGSNLYRVIVLIVLFKRYDLLSEGLRLRYTSVRSSEVSIICLNWRVSIEFA